MSLPTAPPSYDQGNEQMTREAVQTALDFIVQSQTSSYTVVTPTENRSIDANTISLTNLGQVVATLIRDLQTKGIV